MPLVTSYNKTDDQHWWQHLIMVQMDNNDNEKSATAVATAEPTIT